MSLSAPVRTNGQRRRGAGYYLMVLSVSMILMIIGLSSLLAVRIQRRGAEGGNDLGAASLYAQSAIDLGMHWIANESTWRTSRGEGSWAIKQPIGEGSFTLEANDLGSSQLLESSADTDSVLLTGTGFKGDARYKLQVTLTPEIRGLDCLEVALDAGGDLTVSSTLTCNQTVSTNGSILAGTATGTSDLEAVGTIDPGSIVGDQTTGITPRTMPDPSTVFDFYADPVTGKGTYIDVSVLPTTGGSPVLKDIVLSPANNPYGPNNLEGIYVIDLMGQRLKIQECRIVGTLVLLNGASDSTAFNTNNWEPAVPNYPSLMVRGDFVFDVAGGQPLSEGSTNVNFNPLGTPYNGDEDTLIDDEYPVIIKGLVYVSGNACSISSMIADFQVFDGTVIVGGTLNAAGGLNLTYQPTFLNNPPPGFAAPVQIMVSPLSWMQVVN